MERWNGDQLPGDEIAIALPLDVEDGTSQGDLIALAGGSGEHPVHVESETVGQFLMAHSERCFVCFDVAELHWKLDEHLKQHGDEEARKVLWDLPRHGRMHDVQLLDQRIRLVEAGINPLPRELDDLVKDYCELDTPSHQTASILEVHRQLLRRTEPILSRLEIDPKLVERFGPLGHGIDVQGAIAVHAPDRELEVNLPVAKHLQGKLDEIYCASSHALKEDHAAERVFRGDGAAL